MNAYRVEVVRKPIHTIITIERTVVKMLESTYKKYEELPLFLNAKMVAGILGVSDCSAYELMKEDGFPSMRVGHRYVVPKDKFIQWVEQQTCGLQAEA